MFCLVQPYGRDRYREATVVEIHPTVEAAYAALDRIAETLRRNSTAEGIEIYVVDEEPHLVARPGAQ